MTVKNSYFFKISLAVIYSLTAVLIPMQTTAQTESNVIQRPCERGPVPTLKIVNHARLKFTLRLREIRPDIPFNIAANIADAVCDELGMLYNPKALTRRTNQLIRQAGY
jgi:hypothetical protein